MDAGQQVQALHAELEALRQDNAALLEALRLAQLGGVDLQGHLSKFNPDAAEQGIFSQDWELRYFVLSGTLLKYYTSERDVGRNYRGVLALEGCVVEVEQPHSSKGPFIFRINDPDGETLLRLSADSLSTAKKWLKTLHTVGVRVRGFRRLAAVTVPGWQPQDSQGSQGTRSLGRSLTSFSRALSGRWSAVTVPSDGAAVGGSVDSELSMTLNRPAGLYHQADDDADDDGGAAAVDSRGSGGERKQTSFAEGEISLQQRPSVGPPLGQVPSVGAAAGAGVVGGGGGGTTTDEDDVLSSDEEDVSRLSKLRRKYRWIKDRLHYGGGGGRAADGSSGVAVGAGSASALTAATVAAAAGSTAATPQLSASSSFRQIGTGSRHRRTASAPLQKQVSWRGHLDVGDELPDADHSSDDVSDMSSSEEDASHSPPRHRMQDAGAAMAAAAAAAGSAAAAGFGNHSQQQQHLHPHHHAMLERIEQEPDGDDAPPKRPQRISAFGEATEAATIAAAGGISDANPAAGAAAADAIGVPPAGPSTPPPAPSAAVLAGAGRSGFSSRQPGITMPSLKPQGTAAVKAKRPPMLGCSPVHIGVKDSILTEHDRHGVMRHEGFLNLGVVVLLATNLRMIMGNLMTYGLRLKVNRAVLQAVVPLPLSQDDIITILAIPLTCVLFALGALMVERLGLRLLWGQEKMLLGLQKKGLPPKEVAARGSATTTRQEAFLLLLNLLNAGGSLVVPCCLVLSNKSSLVPAFVLTVVAIVISMKLATYAHCNTTLRCEARARAVEAAAAGLPVPSTPKSAPSNSFTFSAVSGVSRLHSSNIMRRISRASLAPRSMLAPPTTAAGGYLATAATTTHAAASAGSGSSDVAALRSSATDPSPFITAGLSRAGSLSRRQGLLVVGDVTYPGNLNAKELAYFLAAPTLTYQLNFPRLRQRRWRLLSRWLLLAVLTALAMSFMQVQFMVPCMQSSLVPLREMNYFTFMERLLRLSMPNTGVWLAMFYLVFHLWLNILGELLMFGDRMFYKEWWNAATLADYWKLWNIPVHKWMLRTIFFPLVRRGAARLPSLLFVFFVSAVMHELAVGVPLRMLRGWAFWGMMLQVPLITLTELLRKRLKADTLGNMVFWASFVVFGQPMCLILYYHDWLLANMGEQGWQAAAAEGELAAARMASGQFNATLSSVAGSLVY